MLLVRATYVCAFVVMAAIGGKIRDFSEYSGIITDPIDPDLFSRKEWEQEAGSNEELDLTPPWTGIKPLNLTKLSLKKGGLTKSSISVIARVISSALKKTFSVADVTVVNSPNLTVAPFSLTSQGFTGRTSLVVLGPSVFVSPMEERKKVYDLVELARFLKWDPIFICGVAGGPWPYLGRNSEAAINLSIRNGKVSHRSYEAWIDPSANDPSRQYRVEPLPANETRVALYGSFMVSDGSPAYIIKIVAKNRTSLTDFITVIRKAIDENFPNEYMGLGGIFVVHKGNVSVSITQNFGSSYNWKDGAPQWLSYFEIPAPLVFVGTITNRYSSEKQLVMPLQHFHGWGPGGGGHFETDTTPDIVEYEAYLDIAKHYIRIDEHKSVLG